jgi:nucleosome assembly protein 1-like 1
MQIIPRAIDYFTGKALDYEVMSESESDFMSGDGEEEGSDDDDVRCI